MANEGKRGRRLPRSRRVVESVEWVLNGGAVIRGEIDWRGVFTATVSNPGSASPADREMVADWAKEIAPGLTHDERYRVVWNGC